MRVFYLLITQIKLQGIFNEQTSLFLGILVLSIVLHVFFQEGHFFLLVGCSFAQIVLVLDQGAVHNAFCRVLRCSLRLQVCA